MAMSVLELLPARIAEKSTSHEETVLPIAEALEAIDLLEMKGLRILGWEGWVKTADGKVGHGSAPQGTSHSTRTPVSLVGYAAQFRLLVLHMESSAFLAPLQVGPDGAILASGHSVMELARDGRIARVIPFWEALPPLPDSWPEHLAAPKLGQNRGAA